MGFMKYVRTQWDRAGAVMFALLGLVVLQLGWVGASGTEYLAKQMPYMISGGLFGIFLLGVAAVLWLSADLRDEWRQLRAVEQALIANREERLLGSVEDPAVADKPEPGATTNGNARRSHAKNGHDRGLGAAARVARP